MITQSLVQFHQWQSTNFAGMGGAHWFLIESIILGLILCFVAIPWTTDLMVNASAGLAGKYFGNKSRTLVINASTNNPELANMVVSLALRRAGGIANPLGSNFANIYLMFLVAPLIVLVRWLVTGQSAKARALISLLIREKRLVLSHFVMAAVMFAFSTFAYWAMTGYHQFDTGPDNAVLRSSGWLMFAGLVCVVGIIGFQFWSNGLQKKRAELFEDIDDEEHDASWGMFFGGTAGLIAASAALNAIFLAWSVLYGSSLTTVFGAAVFAGLHYFVGALVTSLPELKVAIDNYERSTSPDLNTALSSASVSNMTNLAIGVLGVLIVVIAQLFGVHFIL